jgi:hypothetical protein
MQMEAISLEKGLGKLPRRLVPRPEQRGMTTDANSLLPRHNLHR